MKSRRNYRLFTLLFLSTLLASTMFAQSRTVYQLKGESDEAWIEFLIPDFMKNTTPEDFSTPHFIRYDYESADQGVLVNVYVSNSPKEEFGLESYFNHQLNQDGFKATYKSLKSDRYYISGTLSDGSVFYQYCVAKYGNGYIYTVEYKKSYADYFSKTIPIIIQGFRVIPRE